MKWWCVCVCVNSHRQWQTMQFNLKHPHLLPLAKLLSATALLAHRHAAIYAKPQGSNVCTHLSRVHTCHKVEGTDNVGVVERQHQRHLTLHRHCCVCVVLDDLDSHITASPPAQHSATQHISMYSHSSVIYLPPACSIPACTFGISSRSHGLSMAALLPKSLCAVKGGHTVSA